MGHICRASSSPRRPGPVLGRADLGQDELMLGRCPGGQGCIMSARARERRASACGPIGLACSVTLGAGPTRGPCCEGAGGSCGGPGPGRGRVRVGAEPFVSGPMAHPWCGVRVQVRADGGRAEREEPRGMVGGTKIADKSSEIGSCPKSFILLDQSLASVCVLSRM